MHKSSVKHRQLLQLYCPSLRLNSNELSEPWYAFDEFGKIKFATLVILQKHEITNDVLCRQSVTHRFCLNRFVEAGTLIKTKSHKGF